MSTQDLAMMCADIEALAGRDLDAAVEINLFRARYLQAGGHDCPAYSDDPLACRQMEAEMGRRGLGRVYAEELHDLLNLWGSGGGTYFDDVFACMVAPFAVRCRAVLLTLRREGGA